jgi:hypothetical protein
VNSFFISPALLTTQRAKLVEAAAALQEKRGIEYKANGQSSNGIEIAGFWDNGFTVGGETSSF